MSNRRFVAVFACIVLASWVGMLAIMAARHHAGDAAALLGSFFNRDLGLAASFGFTALAIYLVTKDHDVTRMEARKADMRRLSLSRFFSPLVVHDLQERSATLNLERRDAAIMFVDLRNFTSFAESASAPDLTTALREYRDIVSEAILRHGGTLDKFIGDGVMAVFGQPVARSDDAQRSMACAMELMEALNHWAQERKRQGRKGLMAGIGLHYGPVMGGILEGGHHSELTVIGDTVNVAQRLETMTKSLGTTLVISGELLAQLESLPQPETWSGKTGVTLQGRRNPIDILYFRPDLCFIQAEVIASSKRSR